MADNETIAAILAAALVQAESGRAMRSSQTVGGNVVYNAATPPDAKRAVAIYRSVLAELASGVQAQSSP